MTGLVLLFLLFLVVIAGLVLIVVVAVRNKRKQQWALWQAVTAMGWYYETRNDQYRGRLYGTPFNHTKYAHVDDVITGMYRGRPIFVCDILHPRMMEFLLADQRAWRWPFRFERADLVTWESGKLDLNTVRWMLDFISDIADRVPSHVWSP